MDYPSDSPPTTSVVGETLTAILAIPEPLPSHLAMDFYRRVCDGGDIGVESIMTELLRTNVWLSESTATTCRCWNQNRRIWVAVKVKELLILLSTCIERMIDILVITQPQDKDLKAMQRKARTTAYAKARFHKIAMKWLVDDRFEEKLDRSAPSELPIAGGKIVSLRHGTTRDRTREDLWTSECPCELLPHGNPLSTIEMFMDQFTCGDQELKHLLHVCLGYCLTGETLSRCWFIFYGRGSNGKSSLMSLIRAILPSHFAPVLSRDVVTKAPKAAAGAPNAQLAPLQYARVANVSETNEGDKLNEATMKLLTGDDSSVVVRLPHSSRSMTITPQVKMLIDQNHVLGLNSADDAIRSRAVVIPCQARFVTYPNGPNEYPRDPNLMERLKTTHLSEVFTWFVRGAVIWYALNGRLPNSTARSNATQEYMALQDPAAYFIWTYLTPWNNPAQQCLLSKQEILANFDQFCAFHGMRPRSWSQQADLMRRLSSYAHHGFPGEWFYLCWRT